MEVWGVLCQELRTVQCRVLTMPHSPALWRSQGPLQCGPEEPPSCPPEHHGVRYGFPCNAGAVPSLQATPRGSGSRCVPTTPCSRQSTGHEAPSTALQGSSCDCHLPPLRSDSRHCLSHTGVYPPRGQGTKTILQAYVSGWAPLSSLLLYS